MVENLSILILFLTNFLSGYSIYKIFFRKTNIFEKIILSQVFSLLFTPILFVILYFIFGFDASLYVLPIVIITVAIFCSRLKQEIYKIQIRKKFLIWLVLFTGIISLIIFYKYFYEFSGASGDVTWHMSIANEIRNLKSLPPVEPCLHGTLIHYQWFWHLMLALVSIYSSYSIFQIMPFFSGYIVLLSLTTCYILCYHYFRNLNLSIWATSFIFLITFAPYAITSSGYMMPLIFLFLYSFVLFIETKSNKVALLSGMIAASFMYFHGFSFTFAALMLFAYLLYKIVFEFHKICKYYKIEILQFIILLAPMVLALPYYLIIKNTVSEIFLFQPFVNLLNMYPIQVFHILLLFLPFGIEKAVKTENKTLLIFMSIMISFFFIVNIFVMKRNQGIERYFLFMTVPIVFITLDYLRDLSFIKRNLVFMIMLSLISYQFLNSAFLASYHPTKNILELDEYFASKWINQNTNKNETILVASQIENGTSYTAISERGAVLCHDLSMATSSTPHTYFDGSPFPVSDYKKYFADVILMYTHPSQDKFIKYDVSYVLLCNSERSFFYKYDLMPYDFESSRAFKKIFDSRTCDIFKLTNPSELPYIVNKSFVDELNFTSYSKWWSI